MNGIISCEFEEEMREKEFNIDEVGVRCTDGEFQTIHKFTLEILTENHVFLEGFFFHL